ncbi:MAG TPA: hypothetical protein VN622_05130 [Clostridia bacterium]|nr:hypothetical protein [Clostridia bacterium]
MATGTNGSTNPTSNANWTPTQGYILAVICLVAGIAVGYFLRGSASTTASPVTATQQAPAGMGMNGGQVTPEQLKHMADKQVEPLLAKLNTTPNDPVLLAEIGNAYYDAQVFNIATEYYGRSLQIAPQNTSVRTDFGTAFWYLGDADKAIAEFDTALKTEPSKANTLLNRGIVKWQGKMDIEGAVADWQKLLDKNPTYENREKVQELIVKAKQHTTMKPGTKTDKPAMIQ